MSLIQNFEKNTIVICPSSSKDSFVKELSKKDNFLNIKFMNKEEILEGATYKYDAEAINYIHKKYNYRYENAKEIAGNLVDDFDQTEKLKFCSNLKKELRTAGFLIENPLFKELFLNKKVLIYKYSKNDLELLNALKKLNVQYEFLDDDKTIYKHKYYSFNDIEEEISFVFSKIIELKNSGISLNNIYLFNYDESYDLLIRKYSYYLTIPIEFEESDLYSNPGYSLFKNYLKDLTIEEAYEKLKLELGKDANDVCGKLANCLVKISNLNLENEEFIEFLDYYAKNTKLKRIKYNEAIKICNENKALNEDDYVFVMNFNLDSFPKVSGETDFYTDEEKEIIGKNTSEIKTIINKERIVDFLIHTKNIFISFKELSEGKKSYKSLLIKELDIEEESTFNDDTCYSYDLLNIRVAKMKDNFESYSVDNKYLHTKSEYLKDNYKKYNFNFKWDEGQIKIPAGFSYSALNDYATCPFQFFIKRILKADCFEDKFVTSLGTLFHKALENDLKGIEFKIENHKQYIDTHFVSERDKFFLDFLMPQVIDVIKKNSDFLKRTNYKKALPETKIYMDLGDGVSLYGEIDKVMLNEEKKSMLVIDYKTGDLSFDPENVKYGFDLQLPIYLILSEFKFGGYSCDGLFIQRICGDPAKLSSLDKEYKLNGILFDGNYELSDLDTSLGKIYKEDNKIEKNSLYIKGLKIAKSGELAIADSKHFSVEEKDQLVEEALNAVREMVAKIKNNEFPILVSSTSEYNLSSKCKLCGCKSICFRKDGFNKRVLGDKK